MKALKTAFLCVVVASPLLMIGCGESTDVSAEVNDNYHKRTNIEGHGPTADQMKKSMGGVTHTGAAMSMPSPDNPNPGGSSGAAPPTGAMKGPAAPGG